MPFRSCIVALIFSAGLTAQDRSEIKQILERLTQLEQQNRVLLEEVRSLRAQIAAGRQPPGDEPAPAEQAAPIAERVTVAEQRIADHAQTKVETDNRMPVQLTGMVLFNAFANSRSNNDQANPTIAGPSTGVFRNGGSFRQTVLGLKYQGPEALGGARISGSIYMDFFGGSGGPLNQTMRLRLATIDVAWRNTTVSAGLDKPILAPREPNSLAQVGVSPLTNAGNLWLWQPQARVEQRFTLSESTALRAQFGVFQTSESFPGLPVLDGYTTTAARPAAQGRFELSHDFAGGRAIEVASGFHASNSRVFGRSVPSRIWSVDWLIRPVTSVDITGAWFRGENVGVVGALRQGVAIRDGVLTSVPSQGGWAQIAVRATDRLTFNIYGGQQDDRNSHLAAGSVGKNIIYAANAIYRLGSNVLTSFEASQVRTAYIAASPRLNTHYDLALAYLF